VPRKIVVRSNVIRNQAQAYHKVRDEVSRSKLRNENHRLCQTPNARRVAYLEIRAISVQVNRRMRETICCRNYNVVLVKRSGPGDARLELATDHNAAD